jgi:transposase
MLRYNEWARSLFARLCHGQKNRRKKAIIAIAGKLLVRCWRAPTRSVGRLRDNQPWQLAASD